MSFTSVLLRFVLSIALVYLLLMPIMMVLAGFLTRHPQWGFAGFLSSLVAFLYTLNRGPKALWVCIVAVVITSVCVQIADRTRLEKPVSVQGNALVTGGSKGIGLSVVEKLLNLSEFAGDIFVVSRSPPPKQLLANKRIKFVRVDLSNTSQVREVGAQLRSQNIQIVVLNAGSGDPRTLPLVTINVVSQTLLALDLMHSLKRVNFVSSDASQMANPKLVGSIHNTCGWTFGGVLDLECYGRTKAMQVLIMRELASKYPNITFSATHPGSIASEIFTPAFESSFDELADSAYLPRFLGPLAQRTVLPLSAFVMDHWFESTSVAADRVLYSLLDERVKSGSSFFFRLPMDGFLPDVVKNATAGANLVREIEALR